MSRKKTFLLIFACVAVGCARKRADDEPSAPPRAEPERAPEAAAPEDSEPPQPAARLTLPAGFRRVGSPERHAAYLPPEAAWREAISRLSELRAEARAADEDLLVTFEAGSMSATARSGRWRLWRLPEGLVLVGVPAHLLLGADLGLEAYGADGTQIPGEKEVVLVTARAADKAGQPREFRLAIKAGATFRSISTPG